MKSFTVLSSAAAACLACCAVPLATALRAGVSAAAAGAAVWGWLGAGLSIAVLAVVLVSRASRRRGCRPNVAGQAGCGCPPPR